MLIEKIKAEEEIIKINATIKTRIFLFIGRRKAKQLGKFKPIQFIAKSTQRAQYNN